MPEMFAVYLIILGLTIVSLLSLWLNVRLWWAGRRKLRDATSMLHGARVNRGVGVQR